MLSHSHYVANNPNTYVQFKPNMQDIIIVVEFENFTLVFLFYYKGNIRHVFFMF